MRGNLGYLCRAVVSALVLGACAVAPASTPSLSAGPATGASNLTPGSSAAPGSATPSSSPSVEAFGFLVRREFDYIVRTESGTTVGELSGANAAVSPSGREVAYWSGPYGSPSRELRVLVPGAGMAERVVLTLAADESGGEVIWSSDESALMVWVTGSKAPSLREVGVTGNVVRTFAELAPLSAGNVWHLVGYDRRAGIVGAAEAGEGGFMTAYIVVRGAPQGAVSRTPATRLILAFSAQASPDGSRVLAIASEAQSIRIWALADFGQAFEVPAGNGRRIWGALWRPGSGGEVGWGVDEKINLFVPQTNSSRTIYRSPGSGGAGAGIGVFRADGSAVVIPDQCGVSPRTAVLLEIASGRTTRIDCEDALLASVRF